MRSIRLASLFLAGGVVMAACSSGPSGDNFTHPSGTSVADIEMDGSTYGVAISRAGRTYVTLLNGSAVTQDPALPLDGFANPITVGDTPPHVVFSPDGKRAYVANQGGNSVSVIDVGVSDVIETIPLPDPGLNLITSRNGTKLFVSTTLKVYVISTSSLEIIDSIAAGPIVNGFARYEDRIYISSRDGGTVMEVDAGTHDILRTFDVPGQPQRIAVSRDGQELLVANEETGLEIWNLPTGQRDTILGFFTYGLGLSPDGRKAYVTDPLHGRVFIVDRLSRVMEDTLDVGGTPRNVAFSREGDEAVITNEAGYVTVVR